MVSEYERNKQENIRKNKELLTSLGLDQPLFEPKAKRIQKSTQSKKRKVPEVTDSTEYENEGPTSKLQRVDSDTSAPSLAPDGGPRRSARNIGKALNYNKEREVKPLAFAAPQSLENTGPMGRQGGTRIHNPKTYGHIPGIAVGTWWYMRADCSADAVHAPWVGGISGGDKGAYSVVLNGGYEDDVDLGYAFTYTGSGGRDLKGTKAKPKNLRTAPQSSDQTFEKFNKMLLRSSETMKPVRVVRGSNSGSRYAPYEGFRYDGLYRVEKAWRERGNNPKGYLVCKYAFKRLPNQPPLPVRANENDGDDMDEDANQKSEQEETVRADECDGVDGGEGGDANEKPEQEEETSEEEVD